MDNIILIIVTPSGSMEPIECDSVHGTVGDDLNGNGGGSYGIRPGGLKALYSLDAGELKAYLDGGLVLYGKSGTGFATFEDNTVTVVTESFEKE